MMRKLFAFVLLFIAFSGVCYAGKTSIMFNTIPADIVEQGQTLKIIGSVSALNSSSCEVFVVIKRNSGSGWIEVKTLVDESLSAGETKTYNLSWSVPSNAELGTYGVYAKTVVSGKRDSYRYPKFNVSEGRSSPQSNCDAKFIGEKYCKLGAVYQKYLQSDCSQIEKKIETCNFGCENGACKNNNSTLEVISSSNISESENKVGSSEQQIAEQDDILYEKSEILYEKSETTPKGHTSENAGGVFSAISGMFSQSSNLSLIGMIVVLVIIGVILWKI